MVSKKTGEFESITKVMDLRGHHSGINALAFSGDSTRVITGDKNGTWRVYRINVRYHIGEDTSLERVVETGKSITLLEVSPDGKTLAIIGKFTFNPFIPVILLFLLFQSSFFRCPSRLSLPFFPSLFPFLLPFNLIFFRFPSLVNWFVVDKKVVQFWDVATGMFVKELDFSKIIDFCSGDVKWFRWSEDSKRFVTVIGQVVHFWKSPIEPKL